MTRAATGLGVGWPSQVHRLKPGERSSSGSRHPQEQASVLTQQQQRCGAALAIGGSIGAGNPARIEPHATAISNVVRMLPVSSAGLGLLLSLLVILLIGILGGSLRIAAGLGFLRVNVNALGLEVGGVLLGVFRQLRPAH